MVLALDIKNFSKSYGSYIAVDNLNLTIEPGEIFGLLGPNGAGKSSTIHSICGVNRFEEGEILVYGKDVAKEPVESKKLIGVSPQEFNVDYFSRVEKMLMFVGGYYGIPLKERRKKVREILNLLNLGKHAKKKFRELSGGMKRRVMLARAIIGDPKLLILDEPTAGLDVELRFELWDLIRLLNQQGKTIILTSHYIEEIERLCSRVAIINHGRLLFLGHKNELLKTYRTLEEAYLTFLKQND